MEALSGNLSLDMIFFFATTVFFLRSCSTKSSFLARVLANSSAGSLKRSSAFVINFLLNAKPPSSRITLDLAGNFYRMSYKSAGEVGTESAEGRWSTEPPLLLPEPSSWQTSVNKA